MRRIILSLAYAGLALLPVILMAQTPTPFPQTLPPNTVVGRVGAGVPGPAEAIPFATLSAQLLNNSQFTSIGIGGTVPASGLEIYNNIPTPSANGQGVFGTTTTGGNQIGGQGSTDDLELLNKNGTLVCNIATGTTILKCVTLQLTNPLAAAYGGTNNAFFQVSGPASVTRTFTFPNSSQSIASLDLAGQTVSGGATVTANNIGTVSSGTTTINCGTAPLQFLTNNGAFTLAAPASDSSCVILVTNGASAGAITPSGFSVGSNTGDATTTTNTQKFSWFIWRINGVSGYRIAAHQ